MSEIAKTIGQRIRQRRLELGYSQDVASEKAGLHPTYIGQLERGEKNATMESIEKICIALELPMEELFYQIVPFEPKHKSAQKCYDLIINQPPKDQERLLTLIEDVIKYKYN